MVDRWQNTRKHNGQKQTYGSRTKVPRKLEDYWYYVGSTRQASDYENTMAKIKQTEADPKDQES